VIWRCPTVRFLDYQKVKDAERQRANELFGTVEEPTALAAKVLPIETKSAICRDADILVLDYGS
jgi:U2 small nuclear ribonucleoprotein A'